MNEEIVKKQHYEDFIGETIEVELTVQECLMGNSTYDVLRSELNLRIMKELKFRNGLLCQFRKVGTSADNNKVKIWGTVTQCEVDC